MHTDLAIDKTVAPELMSLPKAIVVAVRSGFETRRSSRHRALAERN